MQPLCSAPTTLADTPSSIDGKNWKSPFVTGKRPEFRPTLRVSASAVTNFALMPSALKYPSSKAMAIGELHSELDFGNSMVPYLYVVLMVFESPLADDDPDVLTLHASKANTAINVHRIAAPLTTRPWMFNMCSP